MSSNHFSLYEPEFQRIRAILAKMQKELRAELVLLLNRSGQPVAVTGSAGDIDLTALSSLAAANLAATDGLAHLVGEQEFSALFHQGRQRSLHISDVLRRFSLVLVFDSSASLGMVRWKIKRATALLEDVFRDIQRRVERAGPASDHRDRSATKFFSEDEIEKLLGR